MKTDWISPNGTLIYEVPIEEYRIKPEEEDAMSEFKVGDWVRIYSGYLEDKYIEPKEDNQIKVVKLLSMEIVGTEEKIFYTNKDKSDWISVYSDGSLRNFELWQPKEGEWCWFYDKLLNGRIVGPILRQYNQKQLNMIQERILLDNKFTDIDDQYCFYELENIEPFTGELPSFIKENR
jgi:hypothetical protein